MRDAKDVARHTYVSILFVVKSFVQCSKQGVSEFSPLARSNTTLYLSAREAYSGCHKPTTDSLLLVITIFKNIENY